MYHYDITLFWGNSALSKIFSWYAPWNINKVYNNQNSNKGATENGSSGEGCCRCLNSQYFIWIIS